MPACRLPAMRADDGCSTFYYTNQQSARLMFYHDHSWGITRLNVYAGEAAGYTITDNTEKALVNAGLIPAAADDPAARRPGPHLRARRRAAQGHRGRRRQCHGIRPGPHVGRGPLGHQGQLLVPPRLHACPESRRPRRHERLRTVDVRTVVLATGHRHDVRADREPVLRPELQPRRPVDVDLPDRPVLRAGADPRHAQRVSRHGAVQRHADRQRCRLPDRDPAAEVLPDADAQRRQRPVLQLPVVRRRPRPKGNGKSEVTLKAAELAAAQTDPVVSPTPEGANNDAAGPDWVQIASEGGFLPAPAVIDGQQPTTWITDPTRFDVGNVDQHSLLLAPAERADVVVDFSKFAGKTLILYNDAPAAFPARVPSVRLLHRRPGPQPGRCAQRSCPATGPTPARSCR